MNTEELVERIRYIADGLPNEGCGQAADALHEIADKLATPPAAQPRAVVELPGMWERADFEGGATDAAQPLPAQPERAGVLACAADLLADYIRLAVAVDDEDTCVPAIEGLIAELRSTPRQRVVPPDFYTHKASWRNALNLAVKNAPVPTEDSNEPAYWMHEVRAFDRAYAELESTTAPQAQLAEGAVDDLAMLVKQLVHALRKAAPEHALPELAMDYLRRHALLGSALRSTPTSLNDGIELAARWVQERLDDYDSAHGSTDSETGAREYPGRGAGAEYVCELLEIIEGIRALTPPSSSEPAQTTPREPGWSASETGALEPWKNPMYPMADRLLMADGAVSFERKCRRLAQEPAQPVPAGDVGVPTVADVLRARYPVCKSIHPSGWGWDIPRLNEILAAHPTQASTQAERADQVEDAMRLAHAYAVACVDFEQATVAYACAHELRAVMLGAEKKLRAYLTSIHATTPGEAP